MNQQGAVDAAVRLAEKAVALRDNPTELTVQELRDSAIEMKKNVEAQDRTRFGRVVAGIAGAASKIDVLRKVTHVIPVVGPSVGSMLDALARVCEVAQRYCREEREAVLKA